MSPDAMWFLNDSIDNDEYDIDHAVAPIARGDTVTPLALPVSKGDRIEITYPEDADVPESGETEVFHFAGFRGDMVLLVTPDIHERMVERLESGRVPRAVSVVSNGVWDFNTRVQKHAAEVCVERVDVPDGYHAK
jgi:hypothetical protein